MAAAGNSRFAITCGLLRQYMMREQQFRLPPLVETEEAAEETDDGRTMQLFPTRAGTSSKSSHQEQRPEAKRPLTIFYDGRVLVFEDFPADKANELMQLAGSGTSPSAPKDDGAPPVAEKPAAQTSAVPSNLPIARKASLQRFLQKRKERVGAMEPYSKATTTTFPAPEKDAPAAGKLATVEDKPAASWLGL